MADGLLDLLNDTKAGKTNTTMGGYAGAGNYFEPDTMNSDLLDMTTGIGEDNSILGGMNDFMKKNSEIMGLAGAGFNFYNDWNKNKNMEEYMQFNMDKILRDEARTDNSYDNEVYRSKAINDQLAGGQSQYTGMQYMDPTGEQAAATARDRAAYAERNPGGPSAAQAAPQQQGLAGTPYQKPRV